MKFFALGVLLASLSGEAFAQAQHDTLADAIESAVRNNPVLMAQRKERGAADADLSEAQAQLGPQLNLNGSAGASDQQVGRKVTTSAGTFPLDGSSERSSIGLEARQSIWSGGALTAQRNQARAALASADARLDEAQQNLIVGVITAYVDVRRGEEEVEIRETNVSSLHELADAARFRFNVGDATRTDVAQAEAREAGAESELATARAQLEKARATYEQIVGRAPLQLEAPPEAPNLPAALAEALEIARKNNPSIQAARAQEDAGAQGVEIAKGVMAPRLDLVGSASYVSTFQDSQFNDTNLGLVLEFRMPLFNSGLLEAKTRGAREDADRARYQRMAVERQVSAQVTTAWHQVLAAREAVAASQSRSEAAEIALDGAKQELSAGTRTTLDVLDQQRELLDARLARVDAQRAAYLAAYQLLSAMGRLTPETIGK